MREIEIKARVDDSAKLLETLVRAGVQLGAPLTQHDIIWLEPGAQAGEVGRNVLRIRTENDTKTIFTLKKTIASLDKLEHETEVINADEMRSIIDLLGFELYSEVTKTRRKANVGDIEICLDEITGLGTFLEAEMLCADDANGDAVRIKLWELVSIFGIEKTAETTKGYDILMREKKYGK